MCEKQVSISKECIWHTTLTYQPAQTSYTYLVCKFPPSALTIETV